MNQPSSQPETGDEEAAYWCLSFTEGPLSPAEQKDFDRWIANPANQVSFDEAMRIWALSSAAAETPDLIRLRREALKSFGLAHRARWRLRPARRWAWAGAAAALCLAVLGSAPLFLGSREVAYETRVGEQQFATLSDGSRMALDADTEVETHFDEKSRRLTLVRGRARFNVAKDPLHPFAVHVGDKLVVATGTSFSVELLNDEVHVQLFEGQVAVIDMKGGRDGRGLLKANAPLPVETTLAPGQSYSARRDAALPQIASFDPQQAMAWESGQLIFDNEPLASAVAQMNRYSEKKIVIADREAGAVPITGVFRAGDTAAFVEGVTSVTNVRVKASGGEVRLSIK